MVEFVGNFYFVMALSFDCLQDRGTFCHIPQTTRKSSVLLLKGCYFRQAKEGNLKGTEHLILYLDDLFFIFWGKRELNTVLP